MEIQIVAIFFKDPIFKFKEYYHAEDASLPG
jgi:hypothetical protein